MITLSATHQPIKDAVTDCFIFIVPEDVFSAHTLPQTLAQFAANHYPHLSSYLVHHHFKGSYQQQHTIPVVGSSDQRIAHIIIAGMGSLNIPHDQVMEHYRRTLALVIRNASKLKAKEVSLVMPSADLLNTTELYLAEQTAIIANMALYHFNEYFSDNEHPATHIEQLTLHVGADHLKAAQEGVNRGAIIAHAVNQTRYWVDLPPNKLTPEYLADEATRIAKKQKLTYTVFSEPEIIEMGMGGLAGVSKGSDLDCKLVIMKYTAPDANAPTLAFVGKGITFDSGGLSIKPAESMEAMKDDMSGAAAVISTIEAIAQLRPDVNVIAVAPLSENLPSGKATRPGDILRFYNGKTAEIKNTDAEGRLVLADALSYVIKHYNPTVVVDIATLTGACAYALGPFYTGLMSTNDDLAHRIEKVAQTSGDNVWRLPMGDDYKAAIKSDVADICNIGSKSVRAGAITAAHFLENFVGDTPWAHLDIAGTAFHVPGIPYYRNGATGAGTRLLIELATHWTSL